MGWLDLFTGKDVSRRVEEYSEVYGQVLLGMHQKVSKLERDLVRFRELDKEIREVKSIRENVWRTHVKSRSLFAEAMKGQRELSERMEQAERFGKELESQLKRLQDDLADLKDDLERREAQWRDRLALRDYLVGAGFCVVTVLTVWSWWSG